MKNLLSALLISLGLFAALAPSGVRAADTVDNAQINQLTPNGDWVPTQINFTSSNAGQDITVASTGALTINGVTKGNLSSSVVASGGAVSLTTATAKDITTLTLGAGTWRIYGYVDFILASATTTLQQSGIGTTANTLGGQDTTITIAGATTTSSPTLTQPTPFVQVTIATSTTYHLVADITFSAGTVTGYGSIFAQQIK